MSDATTMWPTQPAAAPAAGWFTDPSSATQLRWWDGATWTEHTMSLPSDTPASIETWTPPVMQEQPAAPRRERRRDRGRDAEPSVAAPAAPAVYVPAAQAARDAPYVPISQQYSPMRALTPVRKPGSPNTVPVWLLALLPLIVMPIELAGYFTGLISSQVGYATLSLAVYATVIGLALGDRFALRRRNLNPASALWLLLLPPLVYLIARRVVLKRMGVKSNAPGNVYVLSALAAFALAVVALFPLITTTATTAQVGAFESQAAAQLEATSETTWTVDCPDTAPVLTPGANFSCIASDTTGRSASFIVDVGPQLQLEIRDDSISAG